jgi:hypothetical protein
VHVRVTTKIEDRRGPFQTKHLGFRDFAVVAVLIVAEEETVDATIGLKAFASISHILRRIRGENMFHKFVRDCLAIRRQLCHWNSTKRTATALKFDLCLDRRLLDHSFFSSSVIKGVKEPLPDQELRAIQIAGQPNTLIPALISIDLRAAKRGSFATLSADTKIDVGAGEDHLIRTSRGIATDQNAHRLDACPAGEVLFGNARTPVRRKTAVQKISQNLPLTAVEAQENRPASAPDAAVMVLPERMIVSDACFGALSIVQTGIEIPRKNIDRLNRSTRRRREEIVRPVEAGSSKDAETRAKFESRATIHTSSHFT